MAGMRCEAVDPRRTEEEVVAAGPGIPHIHPATPSRTTTIARPRSLLELDDDVFNCICAYVPLGDLLRNVTLACHEARRRVSVNHTLWQQLWMRYLLSFGDSLILREAEAAAAATAGAAATHSPTTPASVTPPPPPHDTVWRLYHFHHSAERTPRAVRLERLRVARCDMYDTGDTVDVVAPSSSHGASVDAHDCLLQLAHACATQTVTDNLTHTTPTTTTTAVVVASPSPSLVSANAYEATAAKARSTPHSTQHHTHDEQRRCHVDRLQRVLHFLLSTDAHRPRFHDPLWDATREAELEFIRRTRADAAVAHGVSGSRPTRAAKPTKRRNPPEAPPRVAPSLRRPMSWLDDQATSVKVLLLDDDTRSIGDAAAVHEEQVKLLDAITGNWRVAFASQLHPCATGEDGHHTTRGHPPATHHGLGNNGSGGGGGGGGGGHPTWEQVYQRFRDGGGGGTAARYAARAPQRPTGGRGGEGRASATASAAGNADVVEDADGGDDGGAVPSSGNALFDLHLLGYGRRRHVYAAMLANTVDLPDGTGVFFATCVAEPFLRWWCWRSRRAAGGPRPGSPRAAPRPHRPITLAPWTSVLEEAWSPPWLWTVRAIAGDSDGARDPAAGSAALDASVAYSASYSDVSTSASVSASPSSSIHFEVERAEDVRAGAPGDSHEPEPTTVTTAAATAAPASASLEAASAPPRWPSPAAALLFPLPHMLAYWFLLHHVSFYSHQVYRRVWGDQELSTAVCSRIVSPTGHSVECRLFYSLRCAAFPRMFTKMMFTPGVLPSLTLQGKMAERSPYRTGSPSSASTSSSSSSSHPPPSRHAAGREAGRAGAERGPVDSRQVYDLFWTGCGRVEVESRPSISRSNLLRLRTALGLPVDFPMGLLWNVVMFASAIGPAILKEHRHSLHFDHEVTFTDVVADEFGELACYGVGARPPNQRNGTAAVVNPLDAAAAGMRERQAVDALARAMMQDGAAESIRNVPAGLIVSRHTPATSTSLTTASDGLWDGDSDLDHSGNTWSLASSVTSASGYL